MLACCLLRSPLRDSRSFQNRLNELKEESNGAATEDSLLLFLLLKEAGRVFMSNDHLKLYDKEDRASALPRLFASAIVGHTTTDTARIWVRAHEPGDYYLIVSTNTLPESGQPYDIHNQQLRVEDSTGLKPVIGELHEISLKYSTDVTGVIDLENLKAGTRYYYGLFSLIKKRSERWEVGRDAQLSFRTQPAEVEHCVFGFYSCHMPFKDGSAYNMDMWSMFENVLADNNSDFLIGGGDQVYTDGDKSIDIWRWLVKNLNEIAQLSDSKQRDVMLSWYRDIYRSYWGANSTKQVFRSYPNYMIWDDHEIMDGWGSYTDAELRIPALPQSAHSIRPQGGRLPVGLRVSLGPAVLLRHGHARASSI